MLGWKMKDIIAVIKSIFVGQQVPTLTKQYAGKVNVKPGDGLIIEGAAGDVVATAGGAASVTEESRVVMIGVTAVMVINGIRS
jgi:hypothetical protein